MNRIEVLEGPQGTLYGSAAMGGLIKIVTNQPDPTRYSGKVGAELNGYDGGGIGYHLDGVLNIPIVDDKVALRVVATHIYDGGFIKRIPGSFFIPEIRRGGYTTDFPGESLGKVVESATTKHFNNTDDLTSVRATLLVKPDASLTITPSIFYQKVNAAGGNYVSSRIFNGSNLQVFPIIGGADNSSSVDYLILSLPIEYEISFGKLISSTGYFTTKYGRNLPISRFLSLEGIPDNDLVNIDNPNIFDRGRERQFVQEVRFASTLNGPFNFILGGFYRHVENHFTQLGNNAYYLTSPNLIANYGFATSIYYFGDERNSYSEGGLFLDGTYALGRHFELAAGIREYGYRQHNSLASSGYVAANPYNGVQRNDGQLYRFTGSWYPTGKGGQSQVYARASSGFRPGYLTSAFLPANCVAEVQGTGADAGVVNQDSIWNYEVGAKLRSRDRRFDFSTTGYQINWNNIQISRRLNCGSSISANAGTARIRGVEVRGNAIPFDGVRLDASFGYTDAIFTQANSANGINAGDPLPTVAPFTGAAGLQVNPAWVSAYGGYARLGYTYQGRSYYNFARTVERAPVSLTDIRFGVDFKGWAASFYVENLMDIQRSGQCADSGFPVPGERITCVECTAPVRHPRLAEFLI